MSILGEHIKSSEEIIAENKAYIKGFDKSFFQKGFKMLGKHWRVRITLQRNYIG